MLDQRFSHASQEAISACGRTVRHPLSLRPSRRANCFYPQILSPLFFCMSEYSRVMVYHETREKSEKTQDFLLPNFFCSLVPWETITRVFRFCHRLNSKTEED